MTGRDSTTRIFAVWTRLLRAGTTLLSAVEADLKAAMFPPLSWYDVLLELDREGGDGLRPADLERRLLLAQYNVSRLVARLVDAGYAERRPLADDRRGYRLVITAAGTALLQRMWPVYRDSVERHLGGRLRDADAETLTGLLGRLYDRAADDPSKP